MSIWKKARRCSKIHGVATKIAIQTRRTEYPIQKNRVTLYLRKADCWPKASGPAYVRLGKWIVFYSRCLELTRSMQILKWLWTLQSELIWKISQRRRVLHQIRKIWQVALVQWIAGTHRLTWPYGYSPIPFRIASSVKHGYA